MADGLSTGIALSGQLKVDDSAQQNLLQAERAAAQERMAQQAARDKEQKELEKEISKNLYMAQKAIQPINQQRSEQIATSGVAKIISGMKTGELGYAEMWQEAAAVESKLNAVTEYDKQITEAFNLYSKDPGSYGKKTVTIKGKDYNSPAEAYNDPALTPKDIADAYGTTEFAVINNPLLGEDILAYTPRERISPFTFLQDSKILLDDNNYTERFEGAPIRKPEYGDETIIPTGRRLNPELIGGIMKTLLNKEGVLDHYADEAKKQNPNLREGTPEMMDAIIVMANKEMVPFLQKQERRDSNLTFTPKTPRSPNTGARFSNNKIAVFDGEDLIRDVKQPWSADGATGNNYNYLAVAAIEPKTGDVKSNIDIGAGTLIWDSEKGVLRQPKDFEKNAPATPHEMVVLSDGKTQKPYIRYLSALSADEAGDPYAQYTKEGQGADKYKGRTQESFYIPATEANLKRLAESTDTGIEEWNSLKIELQKRATKGGSTSTTDAGTGGNVLGVGVLKKVVEASTDDDEDFNQFKRK